MPDVAVDDVRRFMEDGLKAVGAPASEAAAHADLLIHADTTGHFSHGLNRLEFYINDIVSKACNPKAKPTILKESPGTAWVDGGDALGATVGNYCMEIAIKKAKEVGIGWVCAKRSNHFGMAGYWALKAEREGLIGLAFTNSSPIMVPTRAKKGALGTNPIACAAPASGGDSLVVDLATTTVAMGKIEVQIRKGEPIPEGWAFGPDGNITTDPQLAFKTGRLTPLGGPESNSGYKGYALSSMVEVFASTLSGARPTHKVRAWTLDMVEEPVDLGQCFAAIDPNCFAPGFGVRLAESLQYWRNMEPADPALPVLAPGDKERNNAVVTKKKGKINYTQQQIDTCNSIAKRVGIKTVQVI